MFRTLRRDLKDQRGFSLVELLVVILIIGILAGVGIPALLNQRHKAYDAAAKIQIRKAVTAEQIYNEDHGVYASEDIGPSDTGALVTIEPTLKATPDVIATANASTGFTLVATAAGGQGDVFTYVDNNGNVTRTCSGTGGGCVSGSW